MTIPSCRRIIRISADILTVIMIIAVTIDDLHRRWPMHRGTA